MVLYKIDKKYNFKNNNFITFTFVANFPTKISFCVKCFVQVWHSHYKLYMCIYNYGDI